MARTVVAILDRDDWGADTDIIVIADDVRRTLTWVPRDLWSPRLHNRINSAFALGGCAELLAALAGLGLACDAAICLRRSAAEALLATVDIVVPVRSQLDLWYPLAPTRPIEEGRKQIAFSPPSERLTGERVHQWVGARYAVGRSSSDLFRLERQQVLLKALLETGFDFRPAVADPDLIRTDGNDPLGPLSHIHPDWTMSVVRNVRSATVDGKSVLLKTTLLSRIWHRMKRGLRLH